MLTRNDQPLGFGFDFANNANQLNFAVDSVFTNTEEYTGTPLPPSNSFLLLDGTNFLLLDGTYFLLLGS